VTTAPEIADPAVPKVWTRPQVPASFVAVEGPTGAGKSTLAPRLARRLGATVFSDPFEDNPFLDDLHRADQPDRDERALRIELTFLALRIPQLRQIQHVVARGGSVVTDWCLACSSSRCSRR
jgi:deoxyadenosine/deoxycytidine kinase